MPTTVISTLTTISANTTIAADVTTVFDGTGEYEIEDGWTLTILGPIVAPPRRIFSFPDTGTGVVRFRTADWLGAPPAPLIEIPVQWFGLVGDNDADSAENNSDMWEKLDAALPGEPDWGEGGTIVFPPGLYHFSRTLRIKRSMRIRGTGGGSPFYGENQCALLFPEGVTGIWVQKAWLETGADHTYYTNWLESDYVDPPVTEGGPGNTVLWPPSMAPPNPADGPYLAKEYPQVAQGDYCVISDLCIKSKGKNYLHPADGVLINAPCEFDSVFVRDFSRHGFWADGRDHHNRRANTSLIRFYKCRVNNCGTYLPGHPSGETFGRVQLEGHGFCTTGDESSISIFDQTDVRQCSGAGIYDDGAYGNLVLSAHSASNRGGGFCMGSQGGFNRTVMINAYKEAEPELHYVEGWTTTSPIVMEGFLPNSWDTQATAGPIVIGGHIPGDHTGHADFLSGGVWRLKTLLALGFDIDLVEAVFTAALSISNSAAGGQFMDPQQAVEDRPANVSAYFQAYPGIAGLTCGVYGLGNGTSTSPSVGVLGRGIQESFVGAATGGKFEAVSPHASASATGIYATATGLGTNWAGDFEGDVRVTEGLEVDGYRFEVQAGQLVVIAPDDGVTIIAGPGEPPPQPQVPQPPTGPQPGGSIEQPIAWAVLPHPSGRGSIIIPLGSGVVN